MKSFGCGSNDPGYNPEEIPRDEDSSDKTYPGVLWNKQEVNFFSGYVSLEFDLFASEPVLSGVDPNSSPVGEDITLAEELRLIESLFQLSKVCWSPVLRSHQGELEFYLSKLRHQLGSA